MRSKWIWLSLGLVAGSAWATPQTIVSRATRVSLMELYTSEGCNDCPPAEQWLGGLARDGRLWTQLVPVAFHVTYWDFLGWKDPFDSDAYTLRQQTISAHSGRSIVYTPEFVLDGSEWQGWFDHRPLDLPASPKVGALSLSAVGGRRIQVTFTPTATPSGKLVVDVVLLAFGVESQPDRGENGGKVLREDFVVVSSAQGPLLAGKSGYVTTLSLPPGVKMDAGRYALAGWVSKPGDPTPLQAAGGWLKGQP